MARQVVLDTDIGSDVDDALALAMLLGSPEAELAAVTTVYGDTTLRARLARRFITLAGADVPCYAGAADTLTGRPVWWAGHEGALFDDLDREQVAPGAAVDVLLDAAGLDVVAIGPLTNVAAAIQAGARFRHLTVMGGNFGDDEPEHNIGCDPEAARIVFDSGTPATVCGLEITTQVRIASDAVRRIAAAGRLGAALAAEIEQFWKFRGQPYNVPHDPVAALTLLTPDLFETAPVDISIGPSGASAATPSPSSPVRIVTALDVDAVTEAIIRRSCSYGA